MKRMLLVVLALLFSTMLYPTVASARVSFFIGLNYTYAPYPQFGGGYHGRQYGGVWYCPANTVDVLYDAYGRLVCIVSSPRPRVIGQKKVLTGWETRISNDCADGFRSPDPLPIPKRGEKIKVTCVPE